MWSLWPLQAPWSDRNLAGAEVLQEQRGITNLARAERPVLDVAAGQGLVADVSAGDGRDGKRRPTQRDEQRGRGHHVGVGKATSRSGHGVASESDVLRRAGCPPCR